MVFFSFPVFFQLNILWSLQGMERFLKACVFFGKISPKALFTNAYYVLTLFALMLSKGR